MSGSHVRSAAAAIAGLLVLVAGASPAVAGKPPRPPDPAVTVTPVVDDLTGSGSIVIFVNRPVSDVRSMTCLLDDAVTSCGALVDENSVGTSYSVDVQVPAGDHTFAASVTLRRVKRAVNGSASFTVQSP